MLCLLLLLLMLLVFYVFPAIGYGVVVPPVTSDATGTVTGATSVP